MMFLTLYIFLYLPETTHPLVSFDLIFKFRYQTINVVKYFGLPTCFMKLNVGKSI